MEALLKEITALKERIEVLEKTNCLNGRNDMITEKIEKIEKTEKKEKNQIPMPWTATVNNQCCRALRINHGLFTQCDNKPISNSTFCKTCHNQGLKNGSNLPNSGTVDDRLQQPIMEFTDKKSGKKPTPWIQVIKKLNIPMEDALNQAKENNIDIIPEQLEDSQKKRGRPKKNITNVPDSDEEGGVGDVSPKKKRGRPKKEKPAMETVAGDDLIANIIKNLGPNSNNNEAPSDVSGELEEEKIDEDEDVTEVKKVTIDGVDYLVDNENTVYDMDTQDEIGCYNPETNSIVRDEL